MLEQFEAQMPLHQDVESEDRLKKNYPTRIRTWTNRTKICCATVTLSGKPSLGNLAKVRSRWQGEVSVARTAGFAGFDHPSDVKQFTGNGGCPKLARRCGNSSNHIGTFLPASTGLNPDARVTNMSDPAKWLLLRLSLFAHTF